MVIIAFAIALILTIIFRLRRRQLEAQGGKSFWYHFFDKSLDFLTPFTFIAGFFCLLSLFVSGTSDMLTIEYLRWFENALGHIKSFTALFKLSPFATGVVLIVLYLLGLTRIPSKHTGRMLADLKKYKKYIGTVYTVVVILFSFTFFGVQSDKPAADLRFRITENEKLYGELRQEVEDAVRKEVADKLYFRFYHTLPRDYRIDMARGDDGPEPPDGWSPKPPSGPDGGGGPDVGGGSGGGPIVYDLFDDAGLDGFNDGEAGRQPTEPLAPAPGNVSASRAGRAFEALRRYRKDFQTKSLRLLATEHGREIALQPPKFVTGKFKDYVLKEMMDRHPILEPVFGKLFEIFDKSLEPAIQKVVDKVTGSAVQDPGTIRQLIDIETSAVIKGKSEVYGYSFSDRVKKIRATIAKQWQNVTGAPSYSDPVQTEEESARIKEHIHLLTCPSEENRLNAAGKLAGKGARLTLAQVQLIKKGLILETLRFRLSTTTEGMYVEIPVKYYPALALEGMRSRHVAAADRVAAAEVIYNVETHPPDKQYRKDEVEERMRA